MLLAKKSNNAKYFLLVMLDHCMSHFTDVCAQSDKREKSCHIFEKSHISFKNKKEFFSACQPSFLSVPHSSNLAFVLLLWQLTVTLSGCNSCLFLEEETLSVEELLPPGRQLVV